MLAPLLSHADRVSALQPTAVNRILSEVRELQAQGKAVVSLMRGEPDFPTPPHIVEACSRALRNGRTGYPDNRGEMVLRDAVAQKLQRDNRLQFDAGSEILVTSGATLGIYAAMMALINEGDEVLLPDPVYDAYQSPIRLAGGRIRPIAGRIIDGRFTITAEALDAAWTPAAKVMLLNTPWNPVGAVLTKPELKTITDFCQRRNLTLISDEIYEAITYDGSRHISPLEVAPELRERCVIVNSLSKTYSMTGWRVGYCAGPAALISSMLLVMQQSSRGPSTFVQDAAAEALAGSQDCVAQMGAEYVKRRQRVLQQLGGIPGVQMLAPEGGFFTMADARDWKIPSADIRTRLLRDHGVVVMHGSAYGPGGEGTLRVSFARGGDILSHGLDRLRDGLIQIAESRS